MMMMEVSRDQLDLIAHTYDVVLSQQAWPDVLDGFARIVDARVANVFVSDRSHPEVQVAAASAGISPSTLDAYQRDYAQYEAPAAAKLLTYPARQLVRDYDLMGPTELVPSAQWLKRTLGIHYRVSTRLNDHPAWFDGLTINLGEQHSDYLSRDGERTCQILLPHLAKAVEISRPFQVLRARFRATLAVLDRFHAGVMIVNEQGQVVIKNREADRIIGLKDGLALDHAGGPSAQRSPGDDAKLKAAIRRAIATARSEGLASETLLTIRRPSGADPFVVEISPLHDEGAELENGLRGALLIVVDPDHLSVVSTRGMEQLYDLTPAEAAVLGLLVEGRATKDIADERGTSPATVSTQVKSIFSKTGVQTRSTLVRLALQVNLPIDPPEPDGRT
jgi:DNA-binding CsgD family transcriptional regulator/PAS domain-containing protein